MKKFLLVATVLVAGVAPASAQNLDARQSGLILANFPWCEERPGSPECAKEQAFAAGPKSAPVTASKALKGRAVMHLNRRSAY
jgi:hypothetical protein